jgi:uncharacterized membrane protein YcaP (DUF421 family)
LTGLQRFVLCSNRQRPREEAAIVFNNWTSILRVVVVGILAYPALIVVLRISGKRTLAKLNAFDLVVTVALGSTFATILVSKSVALAEGVLAFVVLASLQFIVALASRRWSAFERLAKSSPRALLIDGNLVPDALRAERITREEIMAAVRSSGHGDLARIARVVLETDGALSVVPASHQGDGSAFADL